VLPAVHRLLDEPRIARFVVLLGSVTVKEQIGAALARARRAPAVPDPGAVADEVVVALAHEAREMFSGVLNGTGILLHTNLGRAPLAAEAIDAIAAAAAGASNLEYDLTSGRRGSRHDRLRSALRAATGAEDALVVNNCAAAVLLMLDTFARAPDGSAREVIVARNELIEIGGGFRLPDVLARSGAQLVEVGTVNKLRLDDYARALGPRTALLLRVHRSNHRIEGFVAGVGPRDLVALGRRAGVPVVEDLGSGALTDLQAYGLPPERTVQEAVAEGFDLVAFSGDKLLGGPQAGIVAGRTAAIARLRANPLLRALRVGSATLAALGATLALHRDATARARIPFYAMLGAPLETLCARAAALTERLRALELDVVAHDAYAGGGTLPLVAIPSIALAWRTARGGATAGAERLRAGTPPVIAQVAEQTVLIDLRTIAPHDDEALGAALGAAG
jgi:L-seryl-tRNA(Ser) seleniumtransferase